MDILMILLVGFGLAFDVFAIAVSQGSVLGDVKARGMVLMCLIVCAWQVVAMTIGYSIASIPNLAEMTDEVRMVWTLISATIFIALGGIKIFLLSKRKAIPEVKSDIDFKKTCGIAASTSIYTLFAGMAAGLITIDAVRMGITICIMTVGLVIIGVYVGYRNGELDKRIYWSGGVFLILAGAITIVRYLFWFLNR